MFVRSKRQRKLLQARDAWMGVMSEFQNDQGLVLMPTPPMLEDRHLTGCQIVSSREIIIEEMLSGGCVTEVGVLAGDFSQLLLEKLSPRELHLIDLDIQS